MCLKPLGIKIIFIDKVLLISTLEEDIFDWKKKINAKDGIHFLLIKIAG